MIFLEIIIFFCFLLDFPLFSVYNYLFSECESVKNEEFPNKKCGFKRGYADVGRQIRTAGTTRIR